MRVSGVERLIIFLGFVLSPTGIFTSCIDLRETQKSSLSFLDVHSGSLQAWSPRGVHMEGSTETQ